MPTSESVQISTEPQNKSTCARLGGQRILGPASLASFLHTSKLFQLKSPLFGVPSVYQIFESPLADLSPLTLATGAEISQLQMFGSRRQVDSVDSWSRQDLQSGAFVLGSCALRTLLAFLLLDRCQN